MPLQREIPDMAQLLQDPVRVEEIQPAEALALLIRASALVVALAARVQGNGQPQEAAEGARLLTIPEAAELLKIPRSYAYELARQGKLPAVRIGPKYVRVRLADLRTWVDTHRENGLDTGRHTALLSARGRLGASPSPKAAHRRAGAIPHVRRGPGPRRRSTEAGHDGNQ